MQRMVAGQLRWALNNVAHSDNPTCAALESVSSRRVFCKAIAARCSAHLQAATCLTACYQLQDVFESTPLAGVCMRCCRKLMPLSLATDHTLWSGLTRDLHTAQTELMPQK